MLNIKFSYLYRDASNYKRWAEVIFSNDDLVSDGQVDRALRGAFQFGDLFIARQIRVPEVFFAAEGYVTIDDHCFHEYGSTESTAEAPTDGYGRSARQFVWEVVREATGGWRTFDPQDPPRSSSRSHARR